MSLTLEEIEKRGENLMRSLKAAKEELKVNKNTIAKEELKVDNKNIISNEMDDKLIVQTEQKEKSIEEITERGEKLLENLSKVRRELGIIKSKKVYKIVCEGVEECYIGSTSSSLEERMSGHIRSYIKWKDEGGRYTSSFVMFEKYGVGNCKMELIEENEDWSIIELLGREQHWIDSMECVNENNAYGNIFGRGNSSSIKLRGYEMQKKIHSSMTRVLKEDMGDDNFKREYGENPEYVIDYDNLFDMMKKGKEDRIQKNKKYRENWRRGKEDKDKKDKIGSHQF
jgi:predicted transcriptional regulator